MLVLDEPSTALAVSDVERLFVFLRKLKAKGVAIIYVSHRMDEIARIADRATILRDGRHVITAPLSELPIDTMIEHIVGRRSKGLSDVERGVAVKGDVLLELDNVSGRHKPENVSLTLHRGEVLGLAGLLGSGRSSLARVIAGIDPVAKGEDPDQGPGRHDPQAGRCDRRRRRAGAGSARHAGHHSCPFGRLQHDPCRHRPAVQAWPRRSKAANDLTDAQIERLRVKTASRDHAVSTLSGGNQQKVVIGKWLATNPDILILDEPTAGIDIGSKSEIIRLVRELAAAGKGDHHDLVRTVRTADRLRPHSRHGGRPRAPGPAARGA